MEEQLQLDTTGSTNIVATQETEPEAASNLSQLKANICELFAKAQYDQIAHLFTTNPKVQHNLQLMEQISLDLYSELCLPNLTEAVYKEDTAKYNCAEELLKVIANYAPAETFLLEMLQLLDEQKSQYVFTSTLRALQIVLLCMRKDKSHALEWTLNAIITCIEELPQPENLGSLTDDAERKLIEQNPEVETILIYYVTTRLFYEPLVKDALEQSSSEQRIFRDTTPNRRNILCCFFTQLLGGSLATLDLTVAEDYIYNKYTIESAKSLTLAITECIKDPICLLEAVEHRLHYKLNKMNDDELYKISRTNIFLIEEKLPTLGVAIYLYMLVVGKFLPNAIPMVYSHVHIMELSLIFCLHMLTTMQSVLIMRSFMLCDALLSRMGKTVIPASALDLDIYRQFCEALCHAITYEADVKTRQLGASVLRKFILQFDAAGQYLIIMNLMSATSNNGIKGFLAVLYKDQAVQALRLCKENSDTLCPTFSGDKFRSILMSHICCLPKGAETDIIEYLDTIMSALNLIRCFALQDLENRTGFWDFLPDIEKNFLTPLREGMYMWMAHCKGQLLRVERANSRAELEEVNDIQLTLDVANGLSDEQKSCDLKDVWEADKANRINVLKQNLLTYDLLNSLLGRAVECVENTRRLRKEKNKDKL